MKSSTLFQTSTPLVKLDEYCAAAQEDGKEPISDLRPISVIHAIAKMIAKITKIFKIIRDIFKITKKKLSMTIHS